MTKTKQGMEVNNTRGHIITVLLQDYFHRGVFKQVIGEKQWSRFEGRLEKNVDVTLALLDRYKIKATFFTLGWIAEHYPEIIKKIASSEHEIACAGYWARSIREMSPVQFKEDLRRSRRALERSGANKIIGYRCAYQWFREKDFWAFDILAEEGYLYDASYRPPAFKAGSNRKHNYCFKYETRSGNIWEFPTSTHSILSFNLPIAGGNYLRQFSHSFMFKCFKEWCDKSESPFVLYFHPWELDEQQPEITAVGKLSKIKQYRNLGKMQWVLPNYFERAKFQTVSQYLNLPLEYQDNSFRDLKAKTSDYHLEAYDLKPKTSNLEAVTVVIPCYNESSSLPYLSKALEELSLASKNLYRLFFLFVDDCSTDDTAVKLEEIFGKDETHRIISHDENKGVAGALLTGIEMAGTETVCTMDADCSYDPLELLKMIPLLKDNVDMVTASPYHKDGFVLGVPKWRLFLSKSLSRMYHLTLNHKIATYTSCFRVCRRSSIIANDNCYNDFRGIIEMLALIDLQGGIIMEFPTTLQSRIFGYSKMKVLKTILGHLKLLFRVIIKKSHNKISEFLTYGTDRLSGEQETKKKEKIVHILFIVENNDVLNDARVWPEAKAAKKDGFEVSIISPKGSLNSKIYEKKQGIEIFRHPRMHEGSGKVGLFIEYLNALFWELILSVKIFIRKPFNIIHVANPPDHLFLIAAIYKLFGVKFIFDHHDLSPELYLAKFKKKKRIIYYTLIALEKISCKLANLVITTNESYKDIVMSRHNINKSKMCVVRNGPIIEEIYIENINKTKNKYLKIIYLGTINKQDGVENLVKSLNILVNRYGITDFCCDIIGGGDGVEGAEALTKKLNMEKYINFRGVIRDRGEVRKYLNGADICAEPAPDSEVNRHSTFIKIMEYMAAKKPIVAYDLKETKYSAADSAIYVKPGDIEGFAKAIKELAENSVLRKKLGGIGFKRIQNEINWHYSAKKLSKAYKVLLSS